MKSLICLFACVAYASAGAIALSTIPDDGQWRPWLDNSILGASPGLATATLGAASVGHGLVAAPLIASHGVGLLGAGHGVGLLGAGHGLIGAGSYIATPHLLHKRSVLATPWAAHGLVAAHAGLINPNALNVPLDTVHVAAAKNAQLISQATEGARNIHGGGIPLALPADTHEVAAGKVAHAIAHETERANHWANAGHGWTAAAGQGLWAGRALGWGAHGAGWGVAAPHSAGWGVAAPHGLIGAHGLW